MFLEKAKALVPGVKLRYAERLKELDEPALRIGLVLPEGVSLLGDEAFMIDDMAVKLSEARKYRVSANMTPVAGEGELLSFGNVAETDLCKDTVIKVNGKESALAAGLKTEAKQPSAKGGASLLEMGNSTLVALIVLVLLIGGSFVWNQISSQREGQMETASKPSPTPVSGSSLPNTTAAPPPGLSEQRQSITESSDELTRKLDVYEMGLRRDGQTAESQKVSRIREQLNALMKGL